MHGRALQSPTLSSLHIPHAFSTRVGGASRGIFDSLSFGNPSDLPLAERDPAGNIRANFDLLLQDIGCAGREVIEVHQVHGAAVHIVRRGQPAHPTPHDTKADALITDDPSRVLAIRVADCVPVLLASENGSLVAAVHAGWRGVVAGVVPSTIRAMRELGADRLVAAIGPCISVDHFEVGDEVVHEFRLVFGDTKFLVKTPAGAKPHIDLKAALARQLLDAGVHRIDSNPHCTFRDRELFFSHRRDKGRTGRMVALISPRQS